MTAEDSLCESKRIEAHAQDSWAALSNLCGLNAAIRLDGSAPSAAENLRARLTSAKTATEGACRVRHRGWEGEVCAHAPFPEAALLPTLSGLHNLTPLQRQTWQNAASY